MPAKKATARKGATARRPPAQARSKAKGPARRRPAAADAPPADAPAPPALSPPAAPAAAPPMAAPPPPGPPAGAVPLPPAGAWGGNLWLLLAAIAGGLVVPWLFMQGYAAIDQPRPAVGAAVPFYLLTFAAAGGYAAALGILHRTDGLWTAIAGGTLGAFVGLPFARSLETSYDSFGGLGILLAYVYGAVAAALVGGVAAGVAYAAWRNRGAWLAGYGVAMAWLAAWGVAALYHAATIQHQADLARAAHASPPAGLLPALVALALAAAVRRRRGYA